jgi:hypothetical protein
MISLAHDPIANLLSVIADLYPDATATIAWKSGLKKTRDAWGATFFPGDGGTPEISLDSSVSRHVCLGCSSEGR